jgi:ABC-2 type transport system ATP-binding protein
MDTSLDSVHAPRHAEETAAPVLDAVGVEKTFRRGMWPSRRSLPVLRGADVRLRPGAGTVTRIGRLGYCPQEPVTYERLTCDEHFELFGRAYRMSAEAEHRSSRELYAALGFERYAATRADQLSGGTLAKLNLGLALLADPEVLLLDEPYAGFDWDTYLRFWELVAQRREVGRSVLIISHFVTDEQRFDRIVELRDGRTVPR